MKAQNTHAQKFYLQILLVKLLFPNFIYALKSFKDYSLLADE